jgi:hypothetical protein
LHSFGDAITLIAVAPFRPNLRLSHEYRWCQRLRPFHAKHTDSVRDPATSHLIGGSKAKELHARLGSAVVAPVNDEAKTDRLSRYGKLHELKLIPVRGQHCILGRVGGVIIAEPTGKVTDGEDEVIAPIAETKPRMFTRSGL